jgi:hypothetical protein
VVDLRETTAPVFIAGLPDIDICRDGGMIIRLTLERNIIISYTDVRAYQK